jgi:hypothetical protein
MRMELSTTLGGHLDKQASFVRAKQREIDELTARLESVSGSLGAANEKITAQANAIADANSRASNALQTPVKAGSSSSTEIAVYNGHHDSSGHSNMLATPAGSAVVSARKSGGSPNVTAKELAKLHADMNVEVRRLYLNVTVAVTNLAY